MCMDIDRNMVSTTGNSVNDRAATTVMRGSGKFCQKGSNFDNIVLLMRGGHFKRAIIGPPVKRHLNGVLLACR